MGMIVLKGLQGPVTVKGQQYGTALELVASTGRQAFGVDYLAIVSSDARRAAQQLATPERVRAFAELVRAEAGTLLASGDSQLASKRREFAGDLLAVLKVTQS